MMGLAVRVVGVFLCLTIHLGAWAETKTCRDYVKEVAQERAAKLSGWYNPLQKFLLTRKFEGPVVKTLGQFADRELDPEFQRAIEFEIADLVEDYETKQNSKLSNKAKFAYVFSAILGPGLLMATDLLDEPMKSVARLFILATFTKVLNAASGPADARINGAVSKWVSKQPTVNNSTIAEQLAIDSKRVSQQAPRMAEPVEQDGINKFLDALRTMSIMLSDGDRWAEKGDEPRAAQQIKDCIETYLVYYTYFKKGEKRIRKKARIYLQPRSREFRDLVYQKFVEDKDREVELTDVARVLDAWMPHTRMQRTTPWSLRSTQIDASPALPPAPLEGESPQPNPSDTASNPGEVQDEDEDNEDEEEAEEPEGPTASRTVRWDPKATDTAFVTR